MLNPETERQMNAAFEQCLVDLGHGIPLNLKMIGDIFGQDFWMLIVLCMANITIDRDSVIINVYPPKES